VLRVENRLRIVCVIILFFNFASFAATEVDPCHGKSGESTAPMDRSVASTLENITPQRCINSLDNFELFSKEETCDCFKDYTKEVKKKPLVSEDEKLNSTGMGLISNMVKLSKEFAEISAAMPSLADPKYGVLNSCSISKPFQFETKGCSTRNPATKERLKKLFSFYMKDNDITGVKGHDSFSLSNLKKKLKDETTMLLNANQKPGVDNGMCTHPSFDNFIKTKEIEKYFLPTNRKELYATIIDGQVNDLGRGPRKLAFFDLILSLNNGGEDKKGKELLIKEWGSIDPEGESWDITTSEKLKSYLAQKLKSKCDQINQQFETAICSNELSDLDRTIPEDEKFDYFVERSSTLIDNNDLEGSLGKVKTLCGTNKAGATLDDYWQTLTGSSKSPSENFNSQMLQSIDKSIYIQKSNLCEDICVKGGEKGPDGFCKKRNIDDVIAQYKCDSVTDEEMKRKCGILKLLKEEGTIKEIEEVLASSDLVIKDPERYGSVSDKIRYGVNTKKKNELLNQFLEIGKPDVKEESKTANKPAKEDNNSRLSTPKVGKQDSVAPKPQESQPKQQKTARVKPNVDMNKQKQLDMDAALNRLETAKGSLSFGRSSKGRSGSSKKSGSGTSSDITEANSRLDSLMATLDNLQKDNSSIDNLIKNMNNPAYGAGTGNDSNNGAGSSYTRRRPTQLANNGAAGGAGSFGSAPSSAGGLPSESSISNPSGGEYVGDIARTDLVGKSSTGVSSPEDGDFSAQTAPGVRKPASLGRGGEAGSSDISKLFQGRLEASKVSDNTNTSNLVQVEVKKGVKEVNLAELLKNRDEINPGEAFILYEVVQNKKIEVTLIPTFSNYKGKRFFAGYRPLDVNGNNRILVEKLKAERNLLTQN
jgi:hypothetical protein